MRKTQSVREDSEETCIEYAWGETTVQNQGENALHSWQVVSLRWRAYPRRELVPPSYVAMLEGNAPKVHIWPAHKVALQGRHGPAPDGQPERFFLI